MKNIIKSVLILAVLATSVVAVQRSGAWFTDEEKVLGNTIDTGTIDISVDGQNPVQQGYHYAIEDLKPSQHEYIDETITNVGSNPLNLFKSYGNFSETELLSSEPKCQEIVGAWTGTSCDGGQRPNDLATRLNYDLRVELLNAQGTEVWWETIYLDSDNKKLTDVGKVFLGMIPAGWSMKVMQSFHMVPQEGTADNKYQGEKLSFDITFDAEQLGKSQIALVHKYLSNTDVSHHVYDGVVAGFSWVVRDRALAFTLTTTGVAGPYTLIAWDDSANGFQWNWNNRSNAIVLAQVNGSGTFNGSVELNKNLIGAKVWLVPGTYGSIGGSPGLFGWAPTTTLFETGLMDYYDADITP